MRERYLTATQLAKRTGYTARYFQALAASGKIEWARRRDDHHGWLFLEAGFEEWFENGRAGGPIWTKEAARLLEIIRVRRFANAGLIYFFECDRWVKIGWTVNLPERRETLQAGSPHEFRLLGAIPGSRSDELYLHNVLRSYRHRGEWFHLAPEISAIIRELCNVACAD